MDSLKVLCFGAGAIGTYVAGSLALQGHPVTFIERARSVGVLRERGLRLELAGDAGVRLVPPEKVAAFASLDEALKTGPFDVALFTIKSYNTAEALESIRPFAEQMPPVLCLQNGVDNEPTIAATLGAEKVIAATVTSSVARNGPGEVVLEKVRGVGLTATHPLSARLFQALDEAGLAPRLFQRPADMKWSKMMINSFGSVSSAILDMTIAEVFSHPGLYAMERRSLNETLAVMQAQDIHVVDLPSTPARLLVSVVKLPAFISAPLMARFVGGGRGRKMPSFHIDLHSGRGKSEVDYYNGAVVRAGARLGVPTPVNKALTETLLALVGGRLPIDAFAHQPEKLLSLCESA